MFRLCFPCCPPVRVKCVVVGASKAFDTVGFKGFIFARISDVCGYQASNTCNAYKIVAIGAPGEVTLDNRKSTITNQA